MALRLRRGTDAERLIITPADGEIIYTTDTKRIFVGDGVTVGGNPVSISSINDVGDVDITTTPPTFGQTLKWNGSAFVPGNDEQVAGTGVIEGNNYRINISADDSTIMVNTATNTLTGDLVGNVTGDVTGDVTGNLTGDVTGDLNGNVLLPDGTILLNRSNGNLYTNVGDLLIDSTLAAFFGDVDGNIRGSLFNQSLTTILVDHVNETFNGTLVGDVKGSVFGDDSTLLVDAINGTITGNFVGSIETADLVNLDGDINIGTNSINPGFTYFSTATNGLFPQSIFNISNIHNDSITNEVGLYRARGTIDNQAIVQSGDVLGSLTWAGNDGSVPQVAGCIKSEVNSVSLNNISADVVIATRNGGIATYEEVIRFKADNGTVAQSYIQFGSLTYAERDALTAAAGMVIWNSDSTQFEGFDGTNWINLADGTTSTAP